MPPLDYEREHESKSCSRRRETADSVVMNNVLIHPLTGVATSPVAGLVHG